jgi:sulfur carrier protein
MNDMTDMNDLNDLNRVTDATQTDMHTGMTIATITVQLDGAPREVAAGMTLAALMQSLGHAPLAMGTAINGDFVPRAQRDRRVLQSGDVVLFFQPIVGG